MSRDPTSGAPGDREAASPGSLATAWGVPGVESHRTIGSTNDRAAELARSGAAPFTTVVADEQTAGRGRRGARWASARDSGLFMSVVLPSSCAGGALPLVVGLAAAEAIEACAPGCAVAIKWPNDLFVGGRKVGGVLCEVAGDRVVAGLGVNLRTPAGGWPEGLSAVATSLDVEVGIHISRMILAGAIVRSVRGRLEGRGAGLRPEVLAALGARDALAGREIWSETSGGGVGAGIDRDGALRLRRADGATVRVVAGQVRLR